MDQHKLGIVILAAGTASRMGKPKQLLVWEGQSLLARAVHTARILSPHTLVVAGAYRDQITAACTALDVPVAFNADWSSGMGSSIRVGVATLMEQFPHLEVVIIMLVDQPLITPDHLAGMVALAQKPARSLVGTAYHSVIGVPALFGATYFPELLALAGQEGARKLLEKHRKSLVTLEFLPASVDLDTPAAWETFLANQQSNADSDGSAQ